MARLSFRLTGFCVLAGVVLVGCGKEPEPFKPQKYDYGNPVALQKMLKENLVQFRQFPASVMEASLKASLEVYAEVSAKNLDFKKVWDSMLAFRNDEYLWWRVAEYPYDDFLIRNRTRT